jgi:hypothetical protein
MRDSSDELISRYFTKKGDNKDYKSWSFLKLIRFRTTSIIITSDTNSSSSINDASNANDDATSSARVTNDILTVHGTNELPQITSNESRDATSITIKNEIIIKLGHSLTLIIF